MAAVERASESGTCRHLAKDEEGVSTGGVEAEREAPAQYLQVSWRVGSTAHL